MKRKTNKTMMKRAAYVAPQIEIVFAAEPCWILANSRSLSGGHDDGDDDGEIVGAKGFNFSFRDPWEGWDENSSENSKK